MTGRVRAKWQWEWRLAAKYPVSACASTRLDVETKCAATMNIDCSNTRNKKYMRY